MVYNVELQISTPWLGDQFPDRSGMRRFLKTENGQIAIDHNKWASALRDAQSDLGSNYDIDAVKFPNGISYGCIQTYTRRYNKTKTDIFESLQKNSKIRFSVVVRTPDFPHAPGAPGLNSLFNHIGEFIGLSPWGNKFNFGRFSVVHITPVKHKEFPCQESQQKSSGLRAVS